MRLMDEETAEYIVVGTLAFLSTGVIAGLVVGAITGDLSDIKVALVLLITDILIYAGYLLHKNRKPKGEAFLDSAVGIKPTFIVSDDCLEQHVTVKVTKLYEDTTNVVEHAAYEPEYVWYDTTKDYIYIVDSRGTHNARLYCLQQGYKFIEDQVYLGEL